MTTNPLVFRFGFALAISIAGFAVVYRRSRTRLPSRPRSFSGAESPSVCKFAIIGLKELRLLNGVTTAFTKVVTSTSTITTSITTTRTTTSSFLFFEFDRKKSENQEDSAMQEEITKLRNQVWSLQENERGLELQLLEYYGMQEQEAAVRELENQIKINSVQAKLNSLKIESLLTDNQKLRAQLIDYSRAVNELEAAKGTIKLLDREEKATSLKRRIETKDDDEEIASRVNRMEELEFEIAKLNCMNSRLSEENLDLTRKLELVQASASGDQKGVAVEEANKTRECNEKLINEIEQMKTDRCADVEQLVYLKWVNACLRYELRNYQPPHGRTGAKDLSKNLSPRSEKMAKQLILEYGNCDADEKSLSCIEFDSEDSYSSPASTAYLEEVSSSSSRHGNSKRKKFLSKLKKLVLSKHNYHKVVNTDRAPISPSSSGRRVSFSVSSIDDMIGRDSCCSLSPSMTEEHSPANQSVDIQTYNEKDESYKGEAGTPSRFQRMAPGDDAATDQSDTPEKAEIKKLATALSDDFKFNRTSHWN